MVIFYLWQFKTIGGWVKSKSIRGTITGAFEGRLAPGGFISPKSDPDEGKSDDRQSDKIKCVNNAMHGETFSLLCKLFR